MEWLKLKNCNCKSFYNDIDIPFFPPEISRDELILKLKKTYSHDKINGCMIYMLLTELDYIDNMLTKTINDIDKSKYMSELIIIQNKLVKIATK